MSHLLHVFCTECGTRNKLNSKFCFKCGNRLQKDVIKEEDEKTKEIIEQRKDLKTRNQTPFVHHETKVANVKDDDETQPLKHDAIQRRPKPDDSVKETVRKAAAPAKEDEKEITNASDTSTDPTNDKNDSESHSSDEEEDTDDEKDHDFHLRASAPSFVPKRRVKRKGAKPKARRKTKGNSKPSSKSPKAASNPIAPDIASSKVTKPDANAAKPAEKKIVSIATTSRVAAVIDNNNSAVSDEYMVCHDGIAETKRAWDEIRYVKKAKATIEYMYCHDTYAWSDAMGKGSKKKLSMRYGVHYESDGAQNAEEDTKNVPCRWYGSAKGCEYGAHCIYSHANPNSVLFCKFFKVKWGGGCQWGKKCKFRHEVYQDSLLEDHDHKQKDLLHTILKDIVQT